MATAVQLVFVLYMLVPITVCDDVFKLVNSSVQLETQKGYTKSEGFDITWTFNKKNNIVKFNGNPPSTVFKSYRDRVEFNEETCSLTLKNLQKSDSGPYDAEVSGETKDSVAMYQLHVLDPVEKPVLTPSLQSNDTCNVTLTCEVQKLSVTCQCYNNNCDMMEKKTSGDTFLSLSLYVSNNFIICNHSNPVSWNNTTMEMKHVKQLCLNKGDKTGSGENMTDTHPDSLIIIITPIIIILLLVIFIIWFLKKGTTNVVNTIYEEVEPKNKGGNKAQSIEMSENHTTAATVYCTVGMPAQACINDESTVSTANPGSKDMDPREVQHNNNKYGETHQNQGAERNYESVDVLPETIYSTVNKAGKPVYKA
ncbi:SLAM family member 9-like isoform X2 [Hemibagrus wyckioides]|uniref:SLAM family member 9-like isoform X2 n=1 Tax=Hemibagrus wyckioides TaxID=337641 RepID=UPI00266B8E96|nr:SLAM family member 9-like isoform X2 [Hemibagrus wyckioides]